MPKIAISYRRADSEAMTGRIFDRLIAHYGKEAIFRDIDDIPPGIDFRVHINQTLLKTHILLAIVGPQWVGVSSDGSADRIQEESDPVRVEVETALRRRVPLIPVLIGATKMPSSDQLPPGLKDFAFRNAVKVDTGQDFDYHMDRLIRAMDAILEQEPKSPPSRETKPPTAPKSSTPGRQPEPEAPRKKDTGGRSAAPLPAAGAKAAVAAMPVSFMPSMPAAADWREVLWPASQQGRVLRLAIAGAVAVLAVAAVVIGLPGNSASFGQRLQTLVGHAGAVNAVAFSPDGQMLVSGSTDKSVKVWDVSGGQLLRTLGGESGVVTSVAFTPNGKRIVSGTLDRSVNVWDSNSGQFLLSARTDTGGSWNRVPSVSAIAISPDGTRVVVGSGDWSVLLLSLVTGEQLAPFKTHNLEHDDVVTSVAFFSNGKVIVSASRDGTVKLWDADTGRILRTLTDHGGPVLSVAASPDGKRLAAAGFGSTIVIWSAAGELLRKITAESDRVESIVFSADSKQIIAAGSNSIIAVFDADSGQLLHSLIGHGGGVKTLAFAPDNHRFASGGEDKTISVWSAN
jgi:WD40 repeat protein